jgi:hypothetical protein
MRAFSWLALLFAICIFGMAHATPPGSSRVDRVHVLLDAPMPVVVPPTTRRSSAARCELEYGCVLGGSQVFDEHASSYGLEGAVAYKQVNMTTEAAAHHISLSMSSCSKITCPDFSQSLTSTVTLFFDQDVPESMFLESPLLSAGGEFGCKDEHNEVVPMYLRVVSEAPQWLLSSRTVQMEVKSANMTDFFVGQVDVSLDPNQASTHARRAHIDQSTSAIMHMHRLLKTQAHHDKNGQKMVSRTQRRLDVEIPTVVTTPPEGCVYSTECVSPQYVVAGLAIGNYCPPDKPTDARDYTAGVDLLSISKTWVPNAKYMAVGQKGSHRRRRSGVDITSDKDGGDGMMMPGTARRRRWSLMNPTANDGDDSVCTDHVQNADHARTCECDGEKVRYHCCNATMSNTGVWDYQKTLNIYEYNYNYDVQGAKAKKELNLPPDCTGTACLVKCKDCYAYLGVKAVYKMTLAHTGTNIGAGKYMIPTKLTKLEAYVEGLATSKIDFEIPKDIEIDATLGPYTVLKKNSSPLFSIEVMIGYLPVKVDFNFEVRIEFGIQAKMEMPEPITGGAFIKATAKYGGTLEENDAGTSYVFTPIATQSLETSYEVPQLSKGLKTMAASINVTAYVIPIVHVLLYTVVPVAFEFRPYVGVNLQKYAEGETQDIHGVDRKCPGTTPDLHYALFYGMDFALRVHRPKIPDKVYLKSREIKTQLPYVKEATDAGWLTHGGNGVTLFANLPIACRVAEDSVGYDVSFLTFGLQGNLIPGGSTVVKPQPSNCTGSGPTSTCFCLKDPAYDPSEIFLLRYPAKDYLTIWPKTMIPKDICPLCSGCLDLTAIIEALAVFEAALDKIMGALQQILERAFQQLVVDKVNAALVAAKLDGSVDTGFPVLDAAQVENITFGSSRRSGDVDLGYSIKAPEGFDARVYSDMIAGKQSELNAGLKTEYDSLVALEAAGGSCDASAAPSNGQVGTCSSSLASGSDCQVQCNSGYVATGKTYCLGTQLSPASCIPESCDASSIIQNAQIGNCTNILASGSSCMPSCNIGYTVNGATTCTAGVLQYATCDADPCTGITAPPNGDVGDCPTSMKHGAGCTPTCKAGYEIQGQGKTTCHAGTLTLAHCEAKHCDTSQAPTHGSAGTCREYLASGAQCRFGCDPGYQLSSPAECQFGSLRGGAECLPLMCNYSLVDGVVKVTGADVPDPNFVVLPVDIPPTTTGEVVYSGNITGLVSGTRYMLELQVLLADMYTGDGRVKEISIDGGSNYLDPSECKPKLATEKGDGTDPWSDGSNSDCTMYTCKTNYPKVVTASASYMSVSVKYHVESGASCTCTSDLSSCAATASTAVTAANTQYDTAVAAVANITVTPADFAIPSGSTVIPQCKTAKGYSLFGASGANNAANTTCTSGSFTSEAKCMCNELKCLWYTITCDTPIPNNGARGNCGLTMDADTTCTPTCNTGFELDQDFSCSNYYPWGTAGGLTGGKCNPKKCDFSDFTPPTNGGSGNCSGTLDHGASCAPTCDTGYSASGKLWCQAGSLLATPTCNANPCDDYEGPSAVNGHGYLGTCSTTLNSGDICAVTCEVGYYPTVKGARKPQKPGGDYGTPAPTKCVAANVTEDAICSPKGCDATALPANGKALDGCDGYSLTGTKGWLPNGQKCSPTCNDGFELTRQASCTYGSLEAAICALPGAQQQPAAATAASCDASADPINGTAGTCTATLASGSSCTISCNAGYWPSQATSCLNGNIAVGMCNAIMSGQFTLQIPQSTFGPSSLQSATATTNYHSAFIKAVSEMTNLLEHQITITQVSGSDTTAVDFECLGGIVEILHAVHVLTASTAATSFTSHYKTAATYVAADMTGIPLITTITKAIVRTRAPRPTVPTPAPPPGAVVKEIAQTITFSNALAASAGAWAGDIKNTYEVGWAISIGIYDEAATTYQTGCSVTSEVSARRGVSVIFKANVPEAQAQEAKIASANLGSASLANNIERANTVLGTTVTVPTAADIEQIAVPTMTTVGAAPSTESSSPNVGMIIGIVFGVLALLGIVAGGVWWYMNNANNSEGKDSKDTVIVEMDKPDNNSTEQNDSTDQNPPPPGGSYMKNGVWMDNDGNPITC